jgi:hypothetical protein
VKRVPHSDSVRRNFVFNGVGGWAYRPALAAFEVITQQDFVSGVVTSEQLVKVADNAIFLLDTSSSTVEVAVGGI